MGLWKFLTGIVVLMALLFETRAAYATALLAVLLFFLLRWVVNVSAENLQVTRQAKVTKMFVDDHSEIHLHIKNNCRWPIAWASGYDRLPTILESGQARKWVCSLPPEGIRSVTYNITARQRGLYAIGPLSIAVGDYFGISTKVLTREDYQTVVVYPPVSNLESLSLPSRLPFGNARAQHKIYPDPARLGGVRPYQAGDPLRTIHWQATAKTNELQVKQFEHTVTITTLILLDMDEQDYDVHSFFTDTELAVETAASLAAHVIRQGEACGLTSKATYMRQFAKTHDDGEFQQTTGTIQIQPHLGIPHLMEILTTLAGVKCQKSVSFADLLTEVGQKSGFGTILFVVIPKDTAEIVERSLALVKMGYQIILFVVGEKVEHQGLLRQPSQASLQLYHVKKDSGFKLSKSV